MFRLGSITLLLDRQGAIVSAGWRTELVGQPFLSIAADDEGREAFRRAFADALAWGDRVRVPLVRCCDPRDGQQVWIVSEFSRVAGLVVVLTHRHYQIDALTESERRVLGVLECGTLTSEQVGQLTGVAAGTVRQLAGRIRQKLVIRDAVELAVAKLQLQAFERERE